MDGLPHQVLIFDEADQLLEMGFRPAVEQILAALTPTAATRQTLLFSATLPKDVLRIAQFATRNARLIDTVGEDEEQTNTHVAQTVIVTSLKAQAAELLHLLRELRRSEHKIVVFFPTARQTQLYAEALAQFPCEISVLEMHSRKSQAQRTRVAEQFREGSNVVMFSSDVSARGMDYPDVTAVIQLGMAADKAQYVHRLGRTGRAGKAGGGYLLLCEEEGPFLKMLDELPVTRRAPLKASESAKLTSDFAEAMLRVSASTKVASYLAWLGFYNTFTKRLGWTKSECVRRANLFASTVLGLATPPPIEARTASKMGLVGVPGLVFGTGQSKQGKGHGGGKGGKGRGSGKGGNGHGGGEGRGGGGAREDGGAGPHGRLAGPVLHKTIQKKHKGGGKGGGKGKGKGKGGGGRGWGDTST